MYRLITVSIFYPSLRFPKGFLPFRIPTYNQNFIKTITLFLHTCCVAVIAY